ncbi:sel1 repeat family protein [Thaumasiovibrio subtropicus]|uniref:sel1 repeat family protein n=1 Tax=Thaumasiovibrio subtropicus TaxID=1891207 RepID=UPI000B35AD52|nr:sel1 repeat family protein [Thaumasiovibrio subtropicus]
MERAYKHPQWWLTLLFIFLFIVALAGCQSTLHENVRQAESQPIDTQNDATYHYGETNPDFLTHYIYFPVSHHVVFATTKPQEMTLDAHIAHLEQAANNNDHEAMADLGTYYLLGHGVEQDTKAAIDWLTRIKNTSHLH